MKAYRLEMFRYHEAVYAFGSYEEMADFYKRKSVHRLAEPIENRWHRFDTPFGPVSLTYLGYTDVQCHDYQRVAYESIQG